MEMARRFAAAAAGSGARGANPRGMWFRRRRRGATQLDLSELDRLSELVDRIVTLLPEQRSGPEPTPVPAQPTGERRGVVLFVATPSGYRLVDSGGTELERGDRVELSEGSFRVLRLGPSPLPGDRRGCAFLEREEPFAEARTPDG